MSKNFHPGMGQAVAERTILRKKADGQWETWDDVSHRVALGNSLLCCTEEEQKQEYKILYKHLSKASILMSGRHLQHGDETQPERPYEVFVNCATSFTSFSLFYLLMNGCFSAGTMIRMKDGTLKKIEEVQPNEEVLSYDISKNEFVTRTVKKTYKNKPKPMVLVTLQNGETVKCTADHKFLTPSGWVEAQHLQGMEVISEK